MAIDDSALRALAGTKVGPVSFTEEGTAIVGEMAGSRVSLSVERGTLRAQTTDELPWPNGAGFGSNAIEVMLSRIALSRPELVQVAGDPAGTVTTTLWVDAETSDPLAVAIAIKTVLFTAAAARDAIEAFEAVSVAQDVPLVETAPAPVPEISAGTSPPPPQPPSEPIWCYVEESVAVYDLENHRESWQMEPGMLYQLCESEGEWARVTGPDGAREGWAPTAALKRRGA
jgi:hypothetical protein